MAGPRRHQDGGFAMVALLVGISIVAVALSVALPSWSTAAQRDREAELIFRGGQYARAIALYQRKYANAFPPSLDILVEQRFLRRKFPDPMTKDGEFQVILAGQTLVPQAAQGRGGAAAVPNGQGAPATRTGTGVVPQAGRGGAAPAPQAQSSLQSNLQSGLPSNTQGGIIGVVSKSTATSLRTYNGRTKYNEWAFVATQATTAAGAPNGTQNPTGGIGRPGGPGTGIGGGVGGAGRGQQPQAPNGRGGLNRGGFGGTDQPQRQGTPFGQPRTGAGGLGGRL